MTDGVGRWVASGSPQARLGIAAAVVTVVGSGVALGGWAMGVESLGGDVVGLRSANPNSAAALLAIALAVLSAEFGGRPGRWAALAASAFAALLGAAALSAYLGGPGAALDSLFFVDTSAGGAPPRMAPQTALNVGLLGAAVWVSLLSRRYLRLLTVLTGAVTVISATVLIGYLYGADMLVQPFGARAMSPFAAVTGIGLAIGIYLRVLPTEMWETVTAATPTAVLLRRVLPVSLIGLVAIGYVSLVGFHANVFTVEVEVAAVVVLSGLVLIVLLVHAGFQLNRYVLETERARRQADAANRLLHQQALELNDDVVQKLSTAWLAQATGDTELVDTAVRQATEQAQRIAAELMQARADTDPVVPGSLVRGREPSS